MEEAATTHLAQPVKRWRKSVFFLNVSLWVTNQVLMLTVACAFFQCPGNLIVYFAITFPFYIAVSLLCTIVALRDADVNRIKNPVIKYVVAVFFLGFCQLQQLKFLFLQYKSSRTPTFYASSYGIDALLSGIPFIFACSYCLLRDCDPIYPHSLPAERRKILCCVTFVLLRTVSRGVVSVDYNICRSVFSTWSCKSVNFLVHAIWRLSEVLWRIVLYCVLAMYITRRADRTSTISHWFLLPLLLDYVFTTAMVLHCWQDNIKVKLALATGTMLMVANVLQFSRVPGNPMCTARFNRVFVTYRCTSLVWYFALLYILDVPPAAGSTTVLFINRCPLCFHCVLASGATYASGLFALPWIRASLFVQCDSAFLDAPVVLSLHSPLRAPPSHSSPPLRNLEQLSPKYSSPRLTHGVLPELPLSVSYEMSHPPNRQCLPSVLRSASCWLPLQSATPSFARATQLRSVPSVTTMPLYPCQSASFLSIPRRNSLGPPEIAPASSLSNTVYVAWVRKRDSVLRAPSGEVHVSTSANGTVPRAPPRSAGVTASATSDSTPLRHSHPAHILDSETIEGHSPQSLSRAVQVLAGASSATFSRLPSQHGIELSSMVSSSIPRSPPVGTTSRPESADTRKSATSSAYCLPETDAPQLSMNEWKLGNHQCRNALNEAFERGRTAIPARPS